MMISSFVQIVVQSLETFINIVVFVVKRGTDNNFMKK
jgi:hypothetical protein